MPGPWPEPYDYREFGIKRLHKLRSYSYAFVDNAASLWEELAGIVADKGLGPILRAWAKAVIDPADPGKALGEALMATAREKRVSDWWKRAQQKLVQKGR